MKVFVDTNILVDVFERRQPYYLDSANIIEQGLLGKYTLVTVSLLLATNLTLTVTILLKKFHIESPINTNTGK